MDRRIDISVAACFVLLGMFVIYQAHAISAGIYTDAIGPRPFFYGSAGILVLGGLIIIARRIIGWQRSGGHIVQTEGVADEVGYQGSMLRAGALFLCCALYVIALQPLGYLLATPAFIFAALAVLQQRNFAAMAAVAILFTMFFYYVFAWLLSVRIPVGPFTALFRDLGWVIY